MNGGTGLATVLPGNVLLQNNAVPCRQASASESSLSGWGTDHHTPTKWSSVCQSDWLAGAAWVCLQERSGGGARSAGGLRFLMSDAGIIVFADVDLSPDEVAEDFAHQGLLAVMSWHVSQAPHGEVNVAGMHHLNVSLILRPFVRVAAGVPAMKPFTISYSAKAVSTGQMLIRYGLNISCNRADQQSTGRAVSQKRSGRFASRNSAERRRIQRLNQSNQRNHSTRTPSSSWF